jgi:hypothetical protein
VKARSDKTEIRRLRMALRWVHGMIHDVKAANETEQGFINMAAAHIRESLAPRRARAAKGKA